MQNRRLTSLALGAAVTGILAGAALSSGCRTDKADGHSAASHNGCKGADSCSGKDKNGCKGTNGCSGKEKNACKGANGCKAAGEKQKCGGSNGCGGKEQ